MIDFSGSVPYIALGALIIGSLSLLWNIQSKRHDDKMNIKSEYNEHIQYLMKSVVDSTHTHPGKNRQDDNFGATIKNHQLKENILQHFFTYQETNNVKIFDLYRKHIQLERGIKDVFNHIFHRCFSEINTKSNSEFGVCNDCIDKFGFIEKRKYKKILDSFPRDTGILN